MSNDCRYTVKNGSQFDINHNGYFAKLGAGRLSGIRLNRNSKLIWDLIIRAISVFIRFVSFFSIVANMWLMPVQLVSIGPEWGLPPTHSHNPYRFMNCTNWNKFHGCLHHITGILFYENPQLIMDKEHWGPYVLQRRHGEAPTDRLTGGEPGRIICINVPNIIMVI